MKKIVIFILILILLGAGGTTYYFLKVKTYDLSEDKVLEEITEEEFEIKLPPEGNSVENNASNGINPVGEGKDSSNDENLSSKENKNTAQTGENKPSVSSKVTVETIKDKYRPTFESLEAQANDKINALVGRAASEYKDKVASGEKISYSYFLSKYKTAGEALEANADQAFETIFAALQQELKSNGFDPSEAADVRTSYEAAKKQRRNALLSSAMDKL